MKTDVIQILEANGGSNGQSNALPKGLKDKDVLEMYRLMVLTRLWNDKALSLQRQGRMGTLASVRGQEASNIGLAYPLTQDDWLVPAFREYGAFFTLGLSLKDQFLYWSGDERGNFIPEDKKIVPTQIIVGGHLPHAVGIAYSMKYKKEPGMVLCSFGDGATSQGDFHESMNWASVYDLPVVFVIQNNGWAISMPVEKQSATPLAQKAQAYDIESVRVDGNDVFAVYETVKKYADRARKEHKPALIELVTYRMGDHTTADDATRYRDPEKLAYWQKRDPIDRLRKYMLDSGVWNEEKEKKLIKDIQQEVETAVNEFEAVEPMAPEDLFDYMYAEIPAHLQGQKQQALTEINGGEG